jgi:hypothetical protein
MPATAVTVKNLDHVTPSVKAAPVACDPVNGNRFTNGGTLTLEFTSSAGGTVSVAFAAKTDGQTVTPLTYTLVGAQTVQAGGWPVALYGSEVTVTASVATITVVATAV